MNNILLISEDLLKSETIVNDNINSQSITPSILIAQEIGLQQVIGTKLYKKILSLVDGDTIDDDVNADYKILLDNYIRPYLVNKSISDLVYNLTFKVRQIGVVQLSDEKINTLQLNNLMFLKQRYDNQASYYSILLYNFIKHNRSKYPEFSSNKCYETSSGYDFDNIPINI